MQVSGCIPCKFWYINREMTGKQLQSLIDGLDLSHAEFAQAIGVTRVLITNAVNEKPRGPSAGTAAKIDSALRRGVFHLSEKQMEPSDK
jgi:transcriptional regulator with XRE-family HTH domain